MIVENGVILAESERFTTGLLYTEVDLARLAYERRRLNTFTQDAGMKTVGFELPERPPCPHPEDRSPSLCAVGGKRQAETL